MRSGDILRTGAKQSHQINEIAVRSLKHAPTSIEHITRQFYHRFKHERAGFLACIQGIEDETAREHYASLLLNRLMFTYFIQRKGFLDGDPDYLSTHLRSIQAARGCDTFFRQFLLRLFHEGLGTSHHTPELCSLLGNIPYLDGDLFKPHAIEQSHEALQIPDTAFIHMFSFFDSYQWSLDEQPQGRERTITPRMLGYIFEQYVNQQQMGAYYTKEDVTAYIARNTILPALFDLVSRSYPPLLQTTNQYWQYLSTDPDRYISPQISTVEQLPGETMCAYQKRRTYYTELRSKLIAGQITSIDDFITYNLDSSHFVLTIIKTTTDRPLLTAFYEQLRQIRILDPTCGSGALLLAALDVLQPLYEACLERLQLLCCHPLQATAQQTVLNHQRRYQILKSIVTHNLYGVDLMEQATEICRLRLFLKLVTTLQRIEEIEPLPNITHNIRTGNALVGYTQPETMLHLKQDLAQGFTPDMHLNRALAQEYGIDPDDQAAFQAWCTSHRPLHWVLDFGKVLQHGGFDVILGNPPYVEYTAQSFSYTLHNFTTLPCANLYPCVVERSSQLLAPDGRCSMILPLAAFATKNMLPLIQGFLTWFPASWLSFYHFRPSMLFSGSKVASIPTVIYLAKAAGPQQRFSTSLIKWSVEQRAQVFSQLTYCPITAPRDPENLHYYPKFGHPCENSIMEKLLSQQSIHHYRSSRANHNVMYYRSAGGLYWKIFLNFPWPYQTTSNKQCSFQEAYDRDVFVALLNSSLFWWYYTVTFDSFNLKDYMLFGFRFTYPEDDTTINALKKLCQSLMTDYRRNAEHLTRRQTGSYTVYARKSKTIIDAIDQVLARHYRLNEQELTFIINYDSKYRMGLQEG